MFLAKFHMTLVALGIRPSFSRRADGTGSLGGLSIGGGPKKIIRDRENQSVLEALVSLTKQNYQFSERDWKNWYINQQDPGEINLRRDL